MVEYNKFELDNGLKVIVHQDKTTPIVALNLLYDVGAKDESSEKTGFAHLFEHLMFGGSINIPDFDGPLQLVGGENNAFTNNDITNYYITVPKVNLETAFWLESDRMLSLAFSEKSLEVQRNVVIEEYKQRYLNQPYGDVWLLLRPLAYQVHPYQWPTIGKDISHIENATIDDVKSFFFKHYAPNNAILSIAGNVEVNEIKDLCNKWFGAIPRRNIAIRDIPVEPKQTAPRLLDVKRDVPVDSIFKVYHMCNRKDKAWHSVDLLSDILSNGKSSRLYQNLVLNKQLFSEIDAFISGDIDAGLFIFSGKPMQGVTMKEAELAINEEIEKVKDSISEYELEKVKNKVEANHVYSEISALDKAMNLGYHELLGDGNEINNEMDKYRNVTLKDIHQVAADILTTNNCSTLYYLANDNEEE